MYRLLRPLLFGIDPERAHSLVLGLIGAAGRLRPARELLRGYFLPRRARPVEFAGLTFPNPVGLAAGYDKDCSAWKGLSCLGFGHIELGTVTPRPQDGNPRPRVFRYPAQEAIINRMGFPGRGAEYALEQVPARGSSSLRDGIILGLNIGKNKETPNERAAEDYLACLRLFAGRVDYFAVNVSSPNTLGLRQLQGKTYLSQLLGALVRERAGLWEGQVQKPPLLVKLSPDLSDQELDDALEAVTDSGIEGVIATNTTIFRENLIEPDPGQAGGLSGKPVRHLSTAVIQKIHRRTGGKVPIIGVGGIASERDAREKLDAGASLVQLYTGLVFSGPRLVKDLVETL